MKVSAQKSSIPLLTPYIGELRQEPVVTLGAPSSRSTRPRRSWGVAVDRGISYRPHTLDAIARAKPCLSVMKAMSSTTFCYQKETQSQLFKHAIHQASAGVCRPGLCRDLAPTHMLAFQHTHNSALRIAMGCVRSTHAPHLHAETMVLPLKEHTDMLGV